MRIRIHVPDLDRDPNPTFTLIRRLPSLKGRPVSGHMGPDFVWVADTDKT